MKNININIDNINRFYNRNKIEKKNIKYNAYLIEWNVIIKKLILINYNNTFIDLHKKKKKIINLLIYKYKINFIKIINY